MRFEDFEEGEIPVQEEQVQRSDPIAEALDARGGRGTIGVRADEALTEATP